MSCKEVTDFLSDYLDGTLPLRRCLAFKLHLLLCRDCRNYVGSYAATVKLAQALREQGAPEEVLSMPEKLVQTILAVCGRN
jgi:predicted anti-sigma-YlaC factor YlaD